MDWILVKYGRRQDPRAKKKNEKRRTPHPPSALVKLPLVVEMVDAAGRGLPAV
jgi:hypothetical protein